MKKNREVIRQIIIIAVIGLALTFFRGEYSWSLSFGSLQGTDLETILGYLNLALPILALGLGVGVFVYLRIRRSMDNRSPREEDEEGKS